MNILLIGSGGREHALAWKLTQSPSCDTLYAAPGNPGIAEEATLVALDVTDHAAVIAFCADKQIGLVVIGPEAPLVDGLGDSLRAAGVPVFGPNAKAAQLEGSKGFTKDLCTRANIPTAGYARHTDKAAALADLARFGLPVVIKADGLAAGKGVVIAETPAEAERAVVLAMRERRFGDAGARLVQCNWQRTQGSNGFAWDTHWNNFSAHRDDLVPPYDQAFNALMTDLDRTGKLDETLVVVAAEFGRSPKITRSNSGREHWPEYTRRVAEVVKAEARPPA